MRSKIGLLTALFRSILLIGIAVAGAIFQANSAPGIQMGAGAGRR